MPQEALAQGSQLLDQVGGHLAALQFAAEVIEAVGDEAGSVSVQWEWSDQTSGLSQELR